MNSKTPTYELRQVYEAKTAILLSWELQPPAVQVKNAAYIRGLTRRIRQLFVYLSHRRDDF